MKLSENPKTINFKKKITINIVLLFVFISALIFYLIIPSISNINKMGVEIDALIKDLDNKYYKGQSIEKLDENLKKIEPELENLNKILVSESSEIKFITDLEEVADENNVAQQINFKKADEKNKEKIPIQLTSQGDFLNQINYLEDLERLDYYINVSSLEFSRSSTISKTPAIVGDATQNKNINMIISADVY